LGIGEDEAELYGCAVSFLDRQGTFFFAPDDLEGTGEFVDRALIYDENDRVRVRVTDRKGSIV
jgi:hypothetical protein